MCSLRLLALASAAVLAAQSDASAKASQRVTFDLDRYQGWWQVKTDAGEERAQGECSGLPRCRPWLSLGDGGYELLFSSEPQSERITFTVKDGAVSVTRGGMLVSSEGSTIKLQVLKPVTISLNGYQGPWMIGNWTAAREDAFFTTSGVAQKIELVPLTTYVLSFGSGRSERIRLELTGKVLVIDQRGAVEAVPDAPDRLEVKTIDVVVYPLPGTRVQRWNLGFRQSASGRGQFEGAAVVRLVEGSSFEIALPGERSGASGRSFRTGKGCNMVAQKVTIAPATFHVVPIPASCSTGF